MNVLNKIICLLIGHSWGGGTFHVLNDGGVDEKFCERCLSERYFVE